MTVILKESPILLERFTCIVMILDYGIGAIYD